MGLSLCRVLFSDDILALHGIHGSLAQLLDASGQQWEQLTIQGLWRALNNGFVVETGHQLEEIDRALRLVSSGKLQKACQCLRLLAGWLAALW